jgi:hypothetical protein
MVAGRDDDDARKQDAHRESMTPARKDLVMDADLVQLLRRPLLETESGTDLITCSLCLRVLRGSEWMEAEHVIREIRSYELETSPQLRSAICDFCAESILRRRAQVGERAAA